MTSLYVETEVGWVRIAKTSRPYEEDREGWGEEYDAMWKLGLRFFDAGILCRLVATARDEYATTPGATIDGAPVFDGLGEHERMRDVLMLSLAGVERERQCQGVT